ncbi:Het-C-domain-containing protein [Coprinopsis marcescibilis]|uniref:Het-C-domain-containing protein n=1 Tax=Coprinopsis marcescibilis TaxID=230819 RepID=A0A5C3KHF9_COPMA|nr:Het-C-domain-containing protein [Coprinopsis marcescibilis]
MAHNPPSILLLLLVVFAFCLAGNGVYAFGAGNIPSFAYMEGKAFRHGDIEDILETLLKKAGGSGFAIASAIGIGGRKFNGLDIKRVYFGNWLRDYSQAVDIAMLKRVQMQTILNLCMVLGFMAHGYATNEFEVTEERLGCYLPTEHIDNPKGYGDGEDARKYHPKLRGPVDPRELDIDPRTGMKNYIANEDGPWDTSKALVRRILEQCILHGRRHRQNGQKQDEYEAYRLLGTALHTLEDFPAHSNFCELALVKMGHREVFTHVGDNVRVQAPNGNWVAPIVTGTFGSDDFFHSLLGEATDHISSASVTDLNKELDRARTTARSTTRGPGGPPCDPADALRDIFFTIPGAGHELSRDLDNIQRIRAGPAQGGKTPEQMSPKEIHSVLWQVLMFRDSVSKKITKTIDKIPGLGSILDKLTESISVFVFTTIEPFLKPLLKSATSGLHSASQEVIDKHDQYEVFNDPRASDPTHSFLSKDHFNLILNEPAGLLAKVIVVNTVEPVIKAWDDESMDVRRVVDDILQSMFHPDFHNPHSKVQREMLQCMQDWYSKLSNSRDAIRRLGKQPVRNHENIRGTGDGGKPAAAGSYAENQGHAMQGKISGYAHNIPGYSAAQQAFGGGGRGFARDGASSDPYGVPTTGEAASFYGGGDSKPHVPPTSHYGHGHGHGHAHSAPPPPTIPSALSVYSPAYSPAPTQAAPQRAGYAPSYAPPPAQSGYPSSGPSFPGSAPTFPGGGPSFPGDGPTFPGGGPSYNPGGAPSFPGGAPSFPGSPTDLYGAPPGGFGQPGPQFPGAPPHGFPGHGHDHRHGGPSFPGAPGGW